MQVWQGPALDAMAAWLAEDVARVEARLAEADARARLTGVLAIHATASAPADDRLARLLTPFYRILRRSRRLAVSTALLFWVPAPCLPVIHC